MVNVIGLGYIGLPTALMLAAHGVEVVGTDYNEELVATLNNGKTTFKEEGLDEALFENVKKAFYGSKIFSLNSVEGVASSMMSSYFDGYDAFDIVDTVSQITLKDLEARLKTQLFEEKSSISVINPQA